jgi:photosystem II stability/assembly factor-like uncharacterized protein
MFFAAGALAALAVGPGARAGTIAPDPVRATAVRRFSVPVIGAVLGPAGGRTYARASDRPNGPVMPRSFWWTRAPGARRWTLLNGQPSPYYPWLLAPDPARPDTVYATGVGGTVFGSLDAGAIWERRGAVPGGNVYQILVVGTDLLLQGNPGYCAPCRSRDGGRSWETSAGQVGELVAAPGDPRVVYSFTAVSIRRSQDGARSFTDVSPAPSEGASDLAVAPSDPDAVYALAPDPAGFLSRTVDGGASWTRLAAPEAGLTWSGPAVDPASSPHVVILGGPADASAPRRLFESFDGGLTWTPRAGTVSATKLRFSGGSIEAFGRRGLFATAGPGDPWAPADRGIVAETGLLLAGAGDGSLYVTAPESGGVWHSSDGGLAWEQRGSAPGLRSLAVDPFDPARLVGLSAGGSDLWWSDDGGRTWTSRKGPATRQGPLFILSLAFDPHRRNTLYTATLEDAWRSGDRGATWSRLTASLRAGTDCTTFHCFKIRDVESIIPDPLVPGHLYAVAHTYESFRTENGGATWKPVRTPVIAASDGPQMRPDPRIKDRLYWGVRVETTVLESRHAGDPPWRALLRTSDFGPFGTDAWLTFDPEGRLFVQPQRDSATFLRRVGDVWEPLSAELPYPEGVQLLDPLVPVPGGGARVFLLVPGLGLFRADFPAPPGPSLPAGDFGVELTPG